MVHTLSISLSHSPSLITNQLVALERAQALAKASVPAPVKNDPIDQVVTQVMSENPNFRVKRVAQGRYIFGQKVLLMRILHGVCSLIERDSIHL